jgi:signal transduction histidine kinase
VADLELPQGNLDNATGRSTAGVATLILAAILFLATVMLGFSMVGRMRDSVDWVVHTYNARNQIRSLRSFSLDLMARVATASALNDPRYLSNLDADLAGQQKSFSLLKSLTQDNPAQQDRFASLAPLLTAMNTHLAPCSTDPGCLPPDPATRTKFLRTLHDRNEQAVAILDSMESDEQALLNARVAAWFRRFRLMVIALAVSFLSAVLLVFFNLRLLANEIKRRSRSERLVREHVDSYRALSGRILELQDIERRKIARELHDSIGQYLAGLKVQVKQLERLTGGNSPTSKELFTETTDVVDRCLAEIRTISHLLHPPLLDELGLYSAARWYVEGFGDRSGIHVKFFVDDFVDRLHKDAEIALFRVLQEALTNVHRHSGAKRVIIDLSCKNNVAILLVKDDGHGIPQETLWRFRQGHGGGIGLAGMRERLAELHGTLTVDSSPSGTTLRASLPTNACRLHRQESAAAVGA